MDDWRYENLRTDVRKLQKEIYELRGRTWKIETWKDLLPHRVMLVIWWLVIAGIWAVAIAR
jgi:hypothetical protein